MRSRKTKEPQSRSKKGFTLAELLIVVAIIGVLVAISIPIFSSQLEKSRKAVDVDNCRTIRSALSVAMIDGTLRFEGSNMENVAVAIFLYNTPHDHSDGYKYVDGGIYTVDSKMALAGVNDNIKKNIYINGTDYTVTSASGNTRFYRLLDLVTLQTNISPSSLKMQQKKSSISYCGILMKSDGTCYYMEGTNTAKPTCYSWDNLETPLN